MGADRDGGAPIRGDVVSADVEPELTLPGRVVRALRTDVPLLFVDALTVGIAYLVTLVVRFDAAVPDAYWLAFRAFLPVVVLLHLASNHLFGLYGQMWRYASVQEARRLVLAGLTSVLLVASASAWLGRTARLMPLSVVVLGAVLAVAGAGVIRFQNRLFAFRRRSAETEPRRVLVIGAGDAGAMLIKDMQRDPTGQLVPVAVLDDDPRKHGRAVHGVPVVGCLAKLVEVAARTRADQVVLAIPSAPGSIVRDVATRCEEAELTLRIVPSLHELVLLGGQVRVHDLRDLDIEDVLFREEVSIDLEAVRTLLQGRRVLITGAGGSIGSEISRQVASFRPEHLVLLDHDETHLHDVSLDLPDSVDHVLALADIRDRDRLDAVFAEARPDVVFHAAAHKHVPILEHQPEEAILTNVVGTANVADAAIAHGTERFVLISTDKAIRPLSVMGASKWCAEQVIRGRQGRGTRFCAVRFGNVLGSRGSVIPTFLRQIERGGPVTITDPEMVRYFMSIREAVQLVLQSATLAEGGEVFTLDMGEPVKIVELARRLIRLAGRVPDRDIPIVFTGIRPGEKLVEEIVDPEEEQVPSAHPSIAVSRPPVPDPAALADAFGQLESLARAGRSREVATELRAIAAATLVPVAEGVG